LTGANKHLTSSCRKYGVDSFKIEVIGFASTQEELNNLEKLWIITLRSYDPEYGYNKTYGGEGGSQTLEARRKKSELFKGHSVSLEARMKISKANKGRKHPETGPKISAANKGRVFTTQHRQNLCKARSIQLADPSYKIRFRSYFLTEKLRRLRSEQGRIRELKKKRIRLRVCYGCFQPFYPSGGNYELERVFCSVDCAVKINSLLNRITHRLARVNT
jgi:hypothetical protein